MDIFSDFCKAYFYFWLFLFLLPPLLRILEHGDGQLKVARPTGLLAYWPNVFRTKVNFSYSKLDVNFYPNYITTYFPLIDIDSPWAI